MQSNFAYGTGALKAISQQLRKDLPGLRGFSESQMYEMRKFYEAWRVLDPNFPVATGKSEFVDFNACSEEIPAIGIVLPETWHILPLIMRRYKPIG